jgi:Flp pilus assembly protein TadG
MIRPATPVTMPCRPRRRALSRLRAHRGSISIELAILMPVFVALAGLATSFGQNAVDQPVVDLAAHNAARAASITRIGANANTAATNAALATFKNAGLACYSSDGKTVVPPTVTPASPPVITNPSPPPPPPGGGPPPPDTGFTTPIGAPATVTYYVGCRVQIVGGLLSTTVLLWSQFTSPLDTYRARG